MRFQNTKIIRIAGVFVVLILLIALSLTSASAQEYTENSDELIAKAVSQEFYIEYGKVLVDTQISFNMPASGYIEFALPFDARVITMHVDREKVDPDLDINVLSYTLQDNSRLRYQYITNSFLERDSFVSNVVTPISTEKFTIKVSLPEKALLEKIKDGRGKDAPAAFPKPTKLETDGLILDVLWAETDVSKGDEFPIMIRYVFPGKYNNILMFGMTILILALVTTILFVRKHKNKPQVIIKPRAHTKQTQAEYQIKIEHHLKEDEEQIVTILKNKEGSCEQGTLRVITGFSKAKISGLLKELEERKIIHKEKRGKKNLVFIKY